MSWKEYQEKTAEVFRAAGCNAEVEAIVKGVRGEHEIDVYVTFEQYGIRCVWAVECKCWNKNVPKEKVLALQSIVNDIGADRGILISKTGFQSGAIKVSSNSNITLTSLEDLIEDLKENSIKRAIESLEINLIKTLSQLFSLSKRERTSQYSWKSYYPEGIDGKKVMSLSSPLCIMQRSFENIKLGVNEYFIYCEGQEKEYKRTESIEVFLESVRNHLTICNLWLIGIENS
jgi:hypothetical protein